MVTKTEFCDNCGWYLPPSGVCTKCVIPATSKEVKTYNTNTYDWYGSYSKCDHWRVNVPINGVPGHLLASGHLNSPKSTPSKWAPYPDMGVYLSPFWIDDLGGMAGVGMAAPITPLWPYIWVTWADMGDISARYFDVLVSTVAAALSEGKTVEIACAAGHGRTGTLLAGVLARVEGLGANAAIKAVRDRYCDQAVETHKQIVMVYELCGEAPPKAPVYKAAVICKCSHADTMHGEQVNTPDYRKGHCVVKQCECAAFEEKVDIKCVCGHSEVTHSIKGNGCLSAQCPCKDYTPPVVETSVVGKPCICSHAKSKHRGHTRVCVQCKCDEYAELPSFSAAALTKPVEPDHVFHKKFPHVCICGHLSSTHDYGVNDECRLCVCNLFVDSDESPLSTDMTHYSLPSRFPLLKQANTQEFNTLKDKLISSAREDD